MTETVKMPANWPEVLESRAAAAHLGDTSGTIDLLRMTADFIRATRSDPAVRDRVSYPDNLISHRVTWLKAMDRLIELEPVTGRPDADERGFWTHEKNAMLAMYACIDRTSPPEPASGLPNEVLERACVVGGCGVVSWDEAVRIAESDPKSSCAIAVPMHRENVRAIIAAALQAIADLPTGKSEDVMEGQEQAYRAVEGFL